jgi:glycosyltransferase involved in cell wall biosynthesis
MNRVQAGETPVLHIENLDPARRHLRLAVVTETYPPEVNGVAITLARLVEELRHRDHAVQLIRPRQGAADQGGTREGVEEVLTRGVPIPRYPNLRMGLPSKRALVRQWTWRRPDVVHIATEGPLGWSALQAARQLRLPVSSDFRTNFHLYSSHYGIGWLEKPVAAYLRKFHNHTHLTTVPTRALQRELAALGYRNLEVVMRGVDTERFAPGRRSEDLRREWGVGPADVVVACVGRLAPEKNLGLLIEGMKRLASSSRPVRLLLVGDGPLRAELAKTFPGVILAGERRGEDLARHYASADVFAFPSLTETFGNVVTEAMASGLAVVAFDRAAAAEVMEHRLTGMKAAEGDEGAFLGHLDAVVEQVGLRNALAREARRRACELGWPAVAARIEQLLISVAARP